MTRSAALAPGLWLLCVLLTAGAAAAAPTTVIPGAASPDADEPALAVSADGEHWGRSLPAPLFEQTTVVPGDTLSARLWVRNDGDLPGPVRIGATDVRLSGPADEEFFDTLLVRMGTPGAPPAPAVPVRRLAQEPDLALVDQVLPVGTPLPVDISIEYSATAAASPRGDLATTAGFDVSIELLGARTVVEGGGAGRVLGDHRSRDRLPWTGADLDRPAAAAAILVGGGAAVWAAARRRRTVTLDDREGTALPL